MKYVLRESTAKKKLPRFQRKYVFQGPYNQHSYLLKA